tara:strand:- start:223 stop:501 length:279 start_codon:yes stop_codon:yes gene_type:complete
MGSKHNKKRYFCVKYIFKPDKKFDEFIELSKKKIGPGKMLEYMVVLDLANEKVLKCELPGIPLAERANIPYKQVLDYYKKYYEEAINTFLHT